MIGRLVRCRCRKQASLEDDVEAAVVEVVEIVAGQVALVELDMGGAVDPVAHPERLGLQIAHGDKGQVGAHLDRVDLLARRRSVAAPQAAPVREDLAGVAMPRACGVDEFDEGVARLGRVVHAKNTGAAPGRVT